MKRPKVSNISQIVFVLSTNMPKPNLYMLDKWLAFSEYSKIKPILIINKLDLDEEEANKIYNLYSKVRI